MMIKKREKILIRKLIIILIFLLILVLSLFGSGFFGEFLKNFNLFLFSNSYYWILPAIYIYIIIIFTNKKFKKKVFKYFIALCLIFTSFDLLINLITINHQLNYEYFLEQTHYNLNNILDNVGLVQSFIIYILTSIIGNIGFIIICIGLFLIGSMIILDMDLIFKKIFNKYKDLRKKKKKKEYKEIKKEEKINKHDPEKNIAFFDEDELNKKKEKKKEYKEIKKEETLENKKYKIGKQNESIMYTLPSANLLNKIKEEDSKNQKLIEISKDKGQKLVESLKTYKLKAEIKNILVGPTITKYELLPELGVKTSKFSSLGNDLAMSLAAKTIRIEAPIPGKSLIGIEVPNEETLMVGLREILQSSKSNFSNKLEVALGKNIYGESIFLDISKTPHLLVAGSTGSGKSVCINTIITSILLKATPNEVKMLMIDPKKVELTPYNGIPHLLSPVITDVESAAVALNQLVSEMEKRYTLFEETKTRNIESYNKLVEKNKEYEKLPYIVAIIDELADLMMIASSEVETAIARLAQMARASGIHMIIATQRPSTDVITGLIKSNIPSRISFLVSSAIDSRTILDKSGAEKLLGYGDMLLSKVGNQSLERIQGAYLSDDEINKIVHFIKEQIKDEQKEKFYEEKFIKLEKKEDIKEEEIEDPLFEEATNIIKREGKISTSLLQRRLKIGYNRASSIVEFMEKKGIVTAIDSANKRKINIERLENYNNEKK